MGDVGTAVMAYQKLGALDFLILLLAGAFCVFTWRIIKAQDKISATLDSLLAKNEVMSSSLSAHAQKATDMAIDMGKAAHCLSNLKLVMAEIKGALKV